MRSLCCHSEGPDKLTKWVSGNLIKFKGKGKSCSQRRNNFMHQDSLGVDQLERSFAKKGPPGCPAGRQQIDHDTAVCPCSKNSQQHPRLSQENNYQQVKEGNLICSSCSWFEQKDSFQPQHFRVSVNKSHYIYRVTHICIVICSTSLSHESESLFQRILISEPYTVKKGKGQQKHNRRSMQ